ncbi:MAG: SDR family NAD(P)-dependent oxidoreductase [Elusimicrobiales bacterium]|nr:SDR family NAD(P)-dependent oxidoreductase [Elusimicrobiales bacterium]
MNNEKIAIVGLGIIAPKALNKEQFWTNVVEGRNCIGEVPADRWDWKLYFSEDHKAADKTYSKIGGFIEGFKFDSIKYKIPPQIATQISRLQQMTIEAVRMALEDSGYDKKPFDPKMTAAVIGNAMGATRKEMTDMRVYKFYNEDVLKKTAAFASLTQDKKDAMISEYEAGIDKDIIKITEDTMPGELANVTAGRIANIFNFNGPNMTMDAACASSMAALDYAVLGLRAGKFDMAVAGGADDMMSPPAYVKFCKIGALSADGSYSFDTRANGFVMAEAVSVYVLKRLSDAVKDGDKIYALINSVGASSDGKGKGITAPNPKGQKIAIENAFAQVDYSPADVDFVEAHGTATKVGDAAEVQVLGEVFGPHMGAGKKLGLTSVKSQIGHSKAAAGAVSIAKTALAIYNKTLPTSINYKTPNPGIDLNLFKVIDKAEPWNKNGLRRANVSSFGFGGTNFHVTMEEYTGPNHQRFAKAGAAAETPAASVEIVENSRAPFANLQGEAVTFTGATPADVIKNAQNEAAAVFSKWPEAYPLAAYAQPSMLKPKAAYGVSVVAKSPKDLLEKVEFMAKNGKAETWTEPPLNFKLKGVYTFKTGTNQAKVGLLFPGQGSQYVDMMRDLAAKYQVVQETFNEADGILEKMIGIRLTEAIWSRPGEGKEELAKREAAIKQTQLTQPSMMTADIAMYRLFREFGIKPDMAIGHSLGEYAAATAAGIFTFENGLRAVTSRAKEMASVKVADPGKMASIALGCDKVDVELKKISGYVICANKNCPLQTVIAGEAKAVEAAVQHFKAMGVEAGEIAVSHAFHSEIVAPAMGPYRNFLQNIPIKAADMKILSNVTADFFPTDPQGIYDMLIKQMTSPVEFIKQLERMYAEGVRTFIECGPKRVLSAFATATFKDKKDITVLASNHPKRGGITELNDLLANMTALGIPVNWNGKAPQNGGRFFNPYYQNWAMKVSAPAASPVPVSGPAALPADKAAFAERYGFNFNPVAVSGIAGGTPGTWDKLFREHNLDEILAGKNMIEQIPGEWREKQIEKNIIRVVKSPTGNHSIEKIDSVDQAIKLSARSGSLDIEKEFGLPHTVAKALDTTFKMAIGAGVLALKDAGLPLVHYYKKTTTGSYLPEKWALPEPAASETGVVFASAFPVTESLLKEVTHFFNHKYAGKTAEQLWGVYHQIVDKLPTEADKAGLRAWLQKEFAGYQPGENKDPYSFSQNFLLKVIPIADSQFAQWVGAKGPSLHVSAACASTTQAVHVAESWIRAGKCKRVVVIAADDITNETIQEWTMPGFLASGTATTKDNVSEAALPFDRRRHGLIAGSGAVGMVIEDETLVHERGMKPLARILLTECANSAYHVTRLDTEHVASVMENFIKKVEHVYGLKKEEIAPYTMFMSHETYTPARGGSAAAEVKALRRAFGPAADRVVVSNVKGFTGHSMGAGLEDVVAVRALNTGIIPPIANYREPDPELAGINLSKGGHYDLKYALRFAAGFGSHMAMSMTERVWKAGESRYEDQGRYNSWIKQVSGDPAAELEVVLNTLRVKDKKTAGKPPVMPAAPVKEPVGAVAAPAPRPAPAAAAPQHYAEPKPAPAHKPAPAGLSEETVRETVLAMITEKTGYPKDMLELDLDMEADLGIDTVKQAELFAAIREHYSIPRKDNISLKDYPTIRHCIKFVLGEKAGSPVAAAPVHAPAAQPAHAAPAPKAAPAPVHAPVAGGVSESDVKENILNMITEKTGYPKDMLELDLDMEADLGIDTVKQAELFAAIRENYSIPRKDNISLKDYPTIRHCIKFVLEEKGGAPAAETAPAQAQAEPQHYAEPKPVQPHSPATSGVSESDVKENILNMITEKTGYPKDMLELDLDMEADLGIDTVKQAELFAAIREHYSIPRKDNISLKDYPTIRHCIKFVLEEKAGPVAAAAPAQAPAPAHVQAPAPQPAHSAPAPAVHRAPAASGVTEDAVKESILNMIADKTGYPKDMLELDLDMEADLGIDTVKQAELFAAMRENYSIPRRDNLSLKDYPTIRHCIKFVMEEKGTTPAVAAAPVQAPAEPQHYAEPKPVPAHLPAASGVGEEAVKESILTMIADKTGYPKDMLELDLDMEADLGIDTVKQAELFAAMREHYSIPRRDNLSLKDYPTIRHCIRFVMEETGKAAQAAAPAPAAEPAKPARRKAGKADQPDLLDLAAPAAQTAAEPLPAQKPARQEHPRRHIRHVPAIIPAPVEQEVIKKLAPKRPVAIFAEDLDLAKAFRTELNKHRADSYIFTPARTKVKDAITVDFKDVPALEKALADFASAHPDTQGVVYLPGCMVKSLSQETAAYDDLKRYALPLFLAAKHLSGGLNKVDPGHATFLAVVTTLDGGFGYRTRDVYDPIYGAIHGQTLCLRKELEKSAVKLLDFEPSSSNQAIVQKTFYEILYSDKRLAIGYADGKRWTLVGKPQALDKSRNLTPLDGRNVLITGGGRGLGAMFARMLAEQHRANILILDIMEIGDKAKRLTGMSDAELKAWKMGELWNEIKAANDKPTPALLEKEFTRLKDAADMHRNMEAIRALGVKVHYYRCDLTDNAMLRQTMENIKADFGSIDGLVHFAGLERSKLAVDKATEEFVLIFNVKAESAVNMWKSGVVKEKGFWVMASSIAGKFGNLGQTDYAAASDYIAKFCVSQHNKGVRALSVDMTGYAQIGMGARPGVEAFLKSQEMEFLYPEEGMQALLDELAYGKVPEIILSGSLGKLDWDKQLMYEPGFSASSSTGLHFTPKVEDLLKGESLSAVKEFSLESDPYLADHAINGTPYVPGVMGLEAFAEAATLLTGTHPKALTDVRFAVPIKLLRGRPADVRVKGLVLGSGAGSEIRIESDFVSPKGLRLGQTRTHFKGTAAADAPSGWNAGMRPDLPKSKKYKHDAAAIYKTYFHGPSFQVLDGVLAVEKNSVLAVFKRPAAPLWKNGTQKLVFHPLVFEALFQACGWRDIQFDRSMALPDAVGAAIVYDNEPQDPETLFLYGVFKGRTEDNRSLYDAWAFDADYNLAAELRDYAMIPTPI